MIQERDENAIIDTIKGISALS